jgi:hypothetical protein
MWQGKHSLFCRVLPVPGRDLFAIIILVLLLLELGFFPLDWLHNALILPLKQL